MAIAEQQNEADLHGFFMLSREDGTDWADRMFQTTCVRHRLRCGPKMPQTEPNEATLPRPETLSGMLLRRPLFKEVKVFLVLGIHADEFGHANDPADPGLLGLVELLEWAVLD